MGSLGLAYFLSVCFPFSAEILLSLLKDHLAINIMATFVHNEPTSLAIIQEAGLPEVFFKALECGLEPVIEASSFDTLPSFLTLIQNSCYRSFRQSPMLLAPSASIR